MIEEINIENFQSHKKTQLVLHPGVNIIIGSTDSGKSAIIRALRWIKDNRPLGNQHCSWWGGGTSVSIKTNDVKVTRCKDKKDEYILSSYSTPFVAFGTSVPVEVSQALNMTEINMQGQLDSPFLLSLTSGEVATYFNKIAGLMKIDTATANINSWVSGLISDIKHDKETLKRKEEEITHFDYLTKFEIEVEVLETMSVKLKKTKTNVYTLSNLLSRRREVENEMKNHMHLLGVETLVTKTLQNMAIRRDILSRINKLTSVIDKRNKYSEELCTLNDMISAEQRVNVLLGLYEECNVKNQQRNRLKKILTQRSNINTQVQEIEAKILRLSASFKTAMGMTCLLCGQTIKHIKS